MVKSPRLALERLQCNHSATLFVRSAWGKSGRLEVWRAPGEKGAASRRAQWRGGCWVVGVLLRGKGTAAFRRGVVGWAGPHSQQRGACRGVCGRVPGGGVVVRGNGRVAHVTASAALRGCCGAGVVMWLRGIALIQFVAQTIDDQAIVLSQLAQAESDAYFN